MVLTDVRSERHPVLDFFITERTVENQRVDVITLDVFPGNVECQVSIKALNHQPDVMLHLALLPTPRTAPDHPPADLNFP